MWGVGTPNALKTTIITTIMNPIKGNKKDEEKKIINEAAGEEYKYGFVTDVETAVIPKGLNEDVVRQISALKGEPEWLLEFRLKAFRHWLTLPQPKWGHVNIPDIDFQDISYYAAPRKRTPQKEIDPEVKKTFDKLGIPLEEQMRLSGMAVDAIMDSVSVHTTYREKLAELGVIFCSISEAVKDYPDLVKKYMGTVVPYTDNFYAALNSAVFSDGSFVYIPKGVRCPMELSSYFRINAAQTGQFERTLIVADDDSYVSYLEGCTAPQRDENQLHAAIVEIIVEERAEVKYSTVQNWYPGASIHQNNICPVITTSQFIKNNLPLNSRQLPSMLHTRAARYIADSVRPPYQHILQLYTFINQRHHGLTGTGPQQYIHVGCAKICIHHYHTFAFFSHGNG